MPSYEYKAVTPTGEIVNEVLEAANEQTVSKEIYHKGYRPVSIKMRKEGKSESSGLFTKKIKADEIILFTRELVTLLRAGVPMLTALEALSSQSSKMMGDVLNQVYVDVMSGKSFSQALDKHPKVFSKLYVNSVYAGEMSGALDEVLERMASVLKHDEETSKKVKSAMKYPIFVLSAMVVAFIVIMAVVVPKFTTIFDSMNMELPLPTKMLLGTSNFIKSNVIAIFVVVVGGVIGMTTFVKTKKGRFWWDGFIMKIPLIGPLASKSSMARFTKMFETLNRSGLPILQTLTTVSTAVGNTVIEKSIRNVAVGVEKGGGIAGSMKKFDLFPPMVIRMISIGEQSGSLDDMLKSIANHYDMEVEYAIKGLTTMIEPLLTIVMAAAVTVLALGIFLPMWGMVGVLK